MTLTIYTVNQSGLAGIRAILEAYSDHQVIDDACINAYASDVEESLEAGNPAMFELSGNHTKSGNPETVTIEGFDIVENADD